uniref:Uncharacterized protein n=1 Tax=Magallana gigas TaxID=29159 RepID=K1PGA8_MAGGI
MALKSLKELYDDMIWRFCRVADNQFRKDMIKVFRKQKTDTLRKRVVESSASSVLKDGTTKLTMMYINNDDSPGKLRSHLKIQSLILETGPLALKGFSKTQLLNIAKAYNLTQSMKSTKATIIDNLIHHIPNCPGIPNTDVLTGDDAPELPSEEAVPSSSSVQTQSEKTVGQDGNVSDIIKTIYDSLIILKFRIIEFIEVMDWSIICSLGIGKRAITSLPSNNTVNNAMYHNQVMSNTFMNQNQMCYGYQNSQMNNCSNSSMMPFQPQRNTFSFVFIFVGKSCIQTKIPVEEMQKTKKNCKECDKIKEELLKADKRIQELEKELLAASTNKTSTDSSCTYKVQTDGRPCVLSSGVAAANHMVEAGVNGVNGVTYVKDAVELSY